MPHAPRPGDHTALARAAAPPGGQALPVEIPGFDTVDTIERLSGDVDLYHRVLEMLIPSLAGTLAKFNAAVAASDVDATRSAVHTVRGMVANVGATSLTRHAAELEAMLNSRMAPPEYLQRFRGMVEETLRHVEQGLAERKAA